MPDEVQEGSPRGEITELLLAWSEGKQSALEQLVPLMYPELHRLAHRCLRGEGAGNTLQTAALVNEAYLRLVDTGRVEWRDRAHFLAVSAQLMRRILVEFARRRQSHKRGYGARLIPLNTALDLHHMRSREMVELDDALNELAKLHSRRANVIEMRFFGGLSVEESAAALGVSQETVMRDWRLARAWLHRELEGQGQHAEL